ncbi:MAG: transposase, partial [Brachybacterium tyrofermentans]
MSRRSVLSDAQWETIQPLLPAQRPWSGRPRRDHRQVVEGIIYRYRCGIAGSSELSVGAPVARDSWG